MSRASSVMKFYKNFQSTERTIGEPVNLASFFNPLAFLNIFKQYSSRYDRVLFFVCVFFFAVSKMVHKICSPFSSNRLTREPLDNLVLECSWKSTVKDAKVTLTVEGLLIEGAYFNVNSLCENTANSPTLSTVPNFKIAWVPSVSVDASVFLICSPMFRVIFVLCMCSCRIKLMTRIPHYMFLFIITPKGKTN